MNCMPVCEMTLMNQTKFLEKQIYQNWLKKKQKIWTDPEQAKKWN